MSNVLWFANWSESHWDRTTETKVCNTLTKAQSLLCARQGYIIRQDEDGNNSLHEMTDGFEPTVSEYKKIRSLVKLGWYLEA